MDFANLWSNIINNFPMSRIQRENGTANSNEAICGLRTDSPSTGWTNGNSKVLLFPQSYPGRF